MKEKEFAHYNLVKPIKELKEEKKNYKLKIQS